MHRIRRCIRDGRVDFSPARRQQDCCWETGCKTGHRRHAGYSNHRNRERFRQAFGRRDADAEACECTGADTNSHRLKIGERESPIR